MKKSMLSVLVVLSMVAVGGLSANAVDREALGAEVPSPNPSGEEGSSTLSPPVTPTPNGEGGGGPDSSQLQPFGGGATENPEGIQRPAAPYFYLPDSCGMSARASFANPGEGGPVLTLEVKDLQTPGNFEGIYQATQIWEVRVCKSSADATPRFKYDHEWMVQNREGSLPSRVFADLSGNQCGDWQKINLSGLHCGANLLQAEVWSPEDCNSSNCTYRTGAVTVQKVCFL